MEGRVLRSFPPEDEAFVAAVETAASELDRLGFSTAGFGSSLQGALRFMYPDVVVVERDPLAALGLVRELWYVYRDGHPSHDVEVVPEPAM
jgi:hypothetical protein